MQKRLFAAVQKYCPSLTVNDLSHGPAGVRAQAVSPDGKLIDDFLLFVTTPRSIRTCNAPSPAATSAIPIGAHIVSKVQALRESQSNPGRTLRAAQRGRTTPHLPLTLQTGSGMQLNGSTLFRQQAFIDGDWRDARGGDVIPVGNASLGSQRQCVLAAKMGAERDARDAINAPPVAPCPHGARSPPRASPISPSLVPV
ncbi:hypothetical protein KCP73_18800 [Salmonella enterica subsp. enterica]|nr:hypothetical protein KCP73_18800 [Salmonella enterica subsp. enterica]